MSEETAGRGRIGAEIYEQVEQLVASEGLNRSQAFERLSEQTGRRAGTVAANYYRIARMKGNVRPRGGGAATGGRRGRPRKAGVAGGELDQALKNLTAAMDEVVALVRRQERDLARLHEQAEQLAKLRKMLG